MSKNITAWNLSSNQELGFVGDSPLICPEWAVVYSHAQETNQLSKALRIIQDHPEQLVEKLCEHFPLVYGQLSVGCGDWAALREQPEESALTPLPH
ncbi:hypothetical protein [Marinobacter sp. F3R08]|uniref:hypothetical protein n=1 Tax=Marinobacter sp. F3R08 TaxID=2841559 RepID=UPI001C0906C2|nr:hypothetical protein [Marinobacter sp. F3R08]MBU2952290.1 hypothetical protein [Marinobacter sp. F3R08]